jgi:RNA recognition motif-containing protein
MSKKELSRDLVEDDYSEDYELESCEGTSKVFVGNVPFQCTKEEFKKCFSNMDGFINADIIRRHRSKLSRGFGFVIFENKENAEKLINKNNIKIKDRSLRFSPYSLENYDTKIIGTKTFQVYINNIDTNTNTEQLKKILENCGEINSCFITTKNGKKFAIVNFVTYESFKNALNSSINYNGVNLDIRPFRKTKKYNTPISNYKNTIFQKNSYQDGFQAGHIVGFQEGFQQGLAAKYLKTSESKTNN